MRKAMVNTSPRDERLLRVMAGLVPAIHVFVASRKQDVDARHKAGHDAGPVLGA
jgi:hypothetical protein